MRTLSDGEPNSDMKYTNIIIDSQVPRVNDLKEGRYVCSTRGY